MKLNHDSANPKGVLATVGHIQETIFFLIFLINCRHHSRCNKKPILQIIKVKRECKFENKQIVTILPVGGRMFLTKMNIAFSGLNLILFRTTYTNWPTVKSAGTRYLHSSQWGTFNFRSNKKNGKTWRMNTKCMNITFQIHSMINEN